MAASEHIQTDLDRDPEWWERWFKKDYSWVGLKKKPWQGWVVVDEACCMPKEDALEGATVREASLQDYWRADPDADWALRELGEPGEADSQAELVRLEDTVWHRAHLPPATLVSGAWSWKVNLKGKRFKAHWERLQADLQARLAQGFETKFDRRGPSEGADGRAQLDGIIINTLTLPHENEQSPVHLSMMRSANLLGINANSTYFGGSARFVSARFGRSANFANANFGGEARFDTASFGEYARFYKATFGGDASFYNARFGRFASFSSSSFGGDAEFDSASFGTSALFFSACFTAHAGFDSASFGRYADFDSALFLRGANYQRGHAPAQAAGRLVRGETGENAAKALSAAPKDTDYALVLSHGAAKRETGAFQSFSFSEGVSLGALDFSDRVFSKAPIFENAQFSGAPCFYRAELHDGVNLLGAQFRYDEGMDAISWDDLVERLKERAGFESENEHTALPSQAALKTAWLNHEKREEVRYRGKEPDDLEPERTNIFWRSAFIAWREYALRLPQADRLKDPTGMNWSDSSRNKRFELAAQDAPHFEQAYRRLKLLMGGMGAHIEEQRFFACELRARQARNPKTDRDIKSWEVFAARAYGALADYGRSALRPVAWLVAVWMLFFTAYTALAFQTEALSLSEPAITQAESEPASENVLTRWGLSEPWASHIEQGLGQAKRVVITTGQAGLKGLTSGPLAFSLELTVAPIGNPIRYHGWAQEIAARGDIGSTVFSILRTLNRILAIPLIFLFALALRRRFQLG